MKKTKLLSAALLATSVLALPQFGHASSHREAPAISGMPRVDATDFYMFRSYEEGREDYVTFIANYIPVQAPYGGPNYFKLDNNASYMINVDNNGDARADLTFAFDFGSGLRGDKGNGISLDIDGKKVAVPLRQVGPITGRGDADINEQETYSVSLMRAGSQPRPLTLASGGATRFIKPIDNIGTKTIPNYAAYAGQHIYTVRIPGCGQGRVFVGQRREAFAVNLGAIFDLVNLVPIDGVGGTQSSSNDDLADANVTSIALEVPISCVTTRKDPVIGAWTAVTVKDGDGRKQVSRLSNPLVNEVVIGLKDKDLFNSVDPTKDAALATYVTHPTLPALLNLLFRDALVDGGLLPASVTDIAPSNFPRTDLVTAFLTGFPGLNQPKGVRASEMLRLNTAVPPTPLEAQNTLGVVAEDLAGFPNGRRPGDDTVDIALRVMMGALCHPVPLGAELKVNGAVENSQSDLVNLGLCDPTDAPVGTVPFTDFAPIAPETVSAVFPYLSNPLPGAGGMRLDN